MASWSLFFQQTSKGLLTKFYQNQRGVIALEYAIMLLGIAVLLTYLFGRDGGLVHSLYTALFDFLPPLMNKLITGE